MSGWLSKASNVFRRATPEVEHPFELACDCGTIHRGLRRARQQRIICRECGAARFVLPKDVYPPPRVVRASPRPVPEPLPVLAPVSEKPPSKATDFDTNPQLATTAIREQKRPSRKPSRPEFLVVNDKKFWSPFRVVSLGIAAVLLLIVVVLVQKQQREYWTKQLRTAGDTVQTALAEQNWIAARDQFQVATTAVTRLRRNDVAALRMRQGLKETTALTGLSSASLMELLEDAEKLADDPDAWKRMFELHYRGQWLGFESPLKKVETDDGEEWRVDFPAPVGEHGRKVVIQANLEAFEVVGELPETQALVFAAQLESCELSKDKQRWEVGLNPKTGFLWSDPRTYAGLGFSFNEWHLEADVLAVLREQSRRIGIGPVSEEKSEDKPQPAADASP